MGFERFIAKRYLRSSQSSSIVSLSGITYISTIGVMIGVAALVITLSVANGFEDEVRSRIIGFEAHVKLRTYRSEGIKNYPKIVPRLDSLKAVKASAPYIEGHALIASATSQNFVRIKCIDPALEPNVTRLVDNIYYGSLNLGPVEVEGEKPFPGIIIGKRLAERLAVTLGDRVQILSASQIKIGSMGMPKFSTFRVAGWFETGLFEYDDLYAFISIKQGQSAFKMKERVTGIQIKLHDIEQANKVADRLTDKLGYPYKADSWFDLHKNLFSWMELEKMMIFLVLSLIIMVAAFNIVGTLIMVVMEKRRDIGILKSMGSLSSGIMKIFVYQGLFAGITGTALGILAGFGFCWSQQEYKWLTIPGDVYIVNSLPMKMAAIDFLAIAAAAVLICLGATIYPARKASKLNPIDAIRDK